MGTGPTNHQGQGAWARSFALFRCSWNVLLEDPSLIVFPLLSFVSILAAMALIFGGGWKLGLSFDPAAAREHVVLTAAVGLAASFVATVCSVFFAVALVICASKRLHGAPAGVRHGLAEAAFCLPQILAWSAFAVTVGFAMRQVERRLPMGLGRWLITVVFGLGWGVATYFVVPEIAFGRGSVFDALKDSVGIVRKQWGETAFLGVGVGSASFVIIVIPTLVLALIGYMGSGVSAYAMAALWFLGASVICSTVQQVYLTALHEYATTGREPLGFAPGAMQTAFRHR